MHRRTRSTTATEPAVGVALLFITLLLVVQSLTLSTAVTVTAPSPNNVYNQVDLFDTDAVGDPAWWGHELDKRLHHESTHAPALTPTGEGNTSPPAKDVTQMPTEELSTQRTAEPTPAAATAETPSQVPAVTAPTQIGTPPPQTPSPLGDPRSAPAKLVHLKEAALLVLCYNRPGMLSKALERVTKSQLSSQIKKYVSQDGDESATQQVAQAADGFEYMSHPRTLPSLLSLNSTLPDRQSKETPGTMYLAAHYKWALDELLLKRKHSHAIIVEDDLSVSNDFFVFFEQLAPLLKSDPTLWCISSWNDNGFGAMFDLPRDQAFRSSYFPGLGWMLTREVWAELSSKWPEDNWDHWMRVSSTHKGRACLVPFLSRNRNMGDHGATASADFFNTFLKNVASLKDHDVREHGTPLFRHPAQLESETYDDELRAVINAAEVVMPPRATPNAATFRSGHHYVVPYLSEEFEMLASMFKLHSFPRTHYKHVTWLQFKRAHIMLVNRRLSPFVPKAHRVAPAPALATVRSSATNENCHETCRAYGKGIAESWHCDEDQFDFINSCDVLAEHFDGCPYGCTQEWGEDIPNMQSWDIGSKPQCLVTEMRPRCRAKHPLTTRICPCVSDSAPPAEGGGGSAGVQRNPRLEVIAADLVDDSCGSVCAKQRRGPVDTLRCDDTQFQFITSCKALKKHFPCKTCARSHGNDMPNFVTKDDDPNNGKCLLPTGPATCFGSHIASRRLCPCVPIEGAAGDARRLGRQ